MRAIKAGIMSFTFASSSILRQLLPLGAGADAALQRALAVVLARQRRATRRGCNETTLGQTVLPLKTFLQHYSHGP